MWLVSEGCVLACGNERNRSTLNAVVTVFDPTRGETALLFVFGDVRDPKPEKPPDPTRTWWKRAGLKCDPT